jgi:mono/diheme cytochrome c family protein
MSRVTIAMLIAGAIAGVPAASFGGAEEGKAVYMKKCHVCHSLGADRGKKAELGGPMDGVGAKHDAESLRAYTVDPKSRKPDSKMPKISLTDQELRTWSSS